MSPRSKVIFKLFRVLYVKPKLYEFFDNNSIRISVSKKWMILLPGKNEWQNGIANVGSAIISLLAMPFLLIWTLIASIYEVLPVIVISQEVQDES